MPEWAMQDAAFRLSNLSCQSWAYCLPRELPALFNLAVTAKSDGSNETAVKYAGIKVAIYKVFVYVYSGIACGIGSVILVSRTGVGSPSLGQGLELDTIAAVVIGGARLSGGKGTVLNTVLGALILGVISNVMNLLGIPGYNQRVVKGLIILSAVLAESLRTRKSNL